MTTSVSYFNNHAYLKGDSFPSQGLHKYLHSERQFKLGKLQLLSDCTFQFCKA